MSNYITREELTCIVSLVDALSDLSLSNVSADVTLRDSNGEKLGYISNQYGGEYTFRTKKTIDE